MPTLAGAWKRFVKVGIGKQLYQTAWFLGSVFKKNLQRRAFPQHQKCLLSFFDVTIFRPQICVFLHKTKHPSTSSPYHTWSIWVYEYMYMIYFVRSTEFHRSHYDPSNVGEWCHSALDNDLDIYHPISIHTFPPHLLKLCPFCQVPGGKKKTDRFVSAKLRWRVNFDWIHTMWVGSLVKVARTLEHCRMIWMSASVSQTKQIIRNLAFQRVFFERWRG